jgi:hypothetical protein
MACIRRLGERPMIRNAAPVEYSGIRVLHVRSEIFAESDDPLDTILGND